MKTLRHLAATTAGLAALAFAGCSSGTTHQLTGFHDPALTEGATPVSLDAEGLSQLASNFSNDGVTRTGTLNAKGFASFVREKAGARGAGDAGGYEEVTVTSPATNLKWEVWTRDKPLVGTPKALKAVAGETLEYKKIYGPFKAGESAKVELQPLAGGGYDQRILLIVTYSPADPGAQATVKIGPVTRR